MVLSDRRLNNTAGEQRWRPPCGGADRPAHRGSPHPDPHQRLSQALGGPRVIGPSRASALGALLAELQEPAERLRKIAAGLQVYRLAP
jgi:hypothetical protein